MRIAILEKLSKELTGGIGTEPKALYLLAETRKYIDGFDESEKENYPNLYFYCNWVLHTKMYRNPTKIILDRFESLFSDTNDLNEMGELFKKHEKDFYLLVDLRNELKNFLTKNGLPLELVENNLKWFKFSKLLSEILLDCPLVKTQGRVKEFAYERGNDAQTRFRVRIRGLGSFKTTLKEK